MKKIRVAVIFGGRSGEHEVSIMSARSVLAHLDPQRYEVVPLAISRAGRWLPPVAARAALEAGVAESDSAGLTLSPGSGGQALVPAQASEEPVETIDVVFPVLHGPYGEDGTIQGLLEMTGLPYVGAGVLSSAVGMDKAIMKAIWQSAGLPLLPSTELLRSRWQLERETILTELEQMPGLTCFVKPCNLGSSVGISKARDRQELARAIDLACRFDRKILIEKAVENPREIELAVLGNDFPEVSVPGEIIHGQDFYDYESKYFKTDGQVTQIPADLPADTVQELQQLALRAYRALDLSGLSRVDFLMDAEGRVYLNEVNTLPGFTPISMYPRLWEASGLPYPQLLDRLIELALERFQDREANQSRPILSSTTPS
ncbi:MAG: D-alanine--D-alanine ligase family protein [Vulcanimicrobiota bacterium]